MMFFIIFVYGLTIGSFLNVCIYRIPKGQSIAYPPSHCTNCNSKLNWKDLIPLFSYLFLRGKCRYCQEKISVRYPIQEFITGVLFVLTYFYFGFSISFIKYSLLFCFLIVISNIDIQYQDVYTVTTIPGIIVGAIFAVFESQLYLTPLWNNFLGAFIAAGIITLIVYTTGGMGKGDIEIAALCGIFLGWKLSILMIILSFVLGGVIGVLLIALKVKGRKDYIAFGPFLALGTLLAIFFGNSMVEYYTKLFF